MKKYLLLFVVSAMSLAAQAQYVIGQYGVQCSYSNIKLQNNSKVKLWADKGLIVRDEKTGVIDLNSSRLEITRSQVIGKNSNTANEEGVVRILNISTVLDKYYSITVELPYNSQAQAKNTVLPSGEIQKLKTAEFNCRLKLIQNNPL